MIIPQNQVKSFEIGPFAILRVSDFCDGQQIEAVLIAFMPTRHGFSVQWRPTLAIKPLFR